MDEDIVGLAMGFFVDNVLDDDDVDERQWQKITVDIEEYWQLGDYSFRLHVRLTKPMVEMLCRELGNHLVEKGRLIREKRPFRHIILMVLWIMATPDCFRSVALRFGVYPNEVHDHFKYIVEAICKIRDRYIVWPSEQERLRIKRNVQRRTGFPGAVGFIDGCHIPISAPLEEAAAYRNRHHQYSVLVQAVCDDKLRITDLYVGEAGSLHDSRVFRRSPLCSNLLQNNTLLGDDEHIVGDSAYPLLDKLMKPYRNDGHLTERQRNFNRMLCSGRVRIEQAFGRIKGQWRRLKYLHCRDAEYMINFIVSCFVLHNFRIVHEENLAAATSVSEEISYECSVDYEPEQDPDDPVDADAIPDPHVPQGNVAVLLQESQVLGEQKRWDICNALPLRAL